MTRSLDDQALEILRANDRGGYTVPTARLYPYQWNWDSAFAALGFSFVDRDRAWAEIETLFDAQWPDGMVPHIIFRRNDPDYFPGPDIWQTNVDPPTSGHSQPPVASSIVYEMVERGDASDLARAHALLPKLIAYHRWFHTARDHQGTGVLGIVHPWESGRDNCPDWDLGMDRIEIADDLGPYQRRDIGHVDPAERPQPAQYDRYLTIIKFGRECGWNHAELARNGPFWMADPGIQFILMRADRDLLRLAQAVGETAAIPEIEAWIAHLEDGCQQLWNPDAGAFCAKDLRTGTFSPCLTNAAMLAHYAGAGTEGQRQRMAETARRVVDDVAFAFPSWDPRGSAFESRRYWRGPIWAVVNYMIQKGLAEHGETRLADRIKTDTLALIARSGFCEYFDPLTGDGLGGRDFTWTAAIHIALSSDATTARAA